MAVDDTGRPTAPETAAWRTILFREIQPDGVLSSDSRKRFILLVTGLLIVLGPVLILVFTLGTLTLFGDLIVGQLTFIELLELYLIELVAFLGLAYGIYRLTLWAVQEPLPTALDALDEESAEGESDGDERR